MTELGCPEVHLCVLQGVFFMPACLPCFAVCSMMDQISLFACFFSVFHSITVMYYNPRGLLSFNNYLYMYDLSVFILSKLSVMSVNGIVSWTR